MIKNNKKLRRETKNTHLNPFCATLLVGVMLFLILIPFISAWEFDNKIKVEDYGAKYPKIKIENVFGLGGSLWEGTLEKNTDVCGVKCSATKEIKLLKDGALVNDVRFIDVTNGQSTETEINNYEFFILNKGEKTKYEVGKELPAGTYTLLLEGEKDFYQNIDWQIYVHGIWLEEWAIWGEEKPIMYWDFNEGSGTNLEDITRNGYNGTLQGTLSSYWVTDGILSGAINFSGNTNNFINYTSPAIPNWSISIWTKVNDKKKEYSGAGQTYQVILWVLDMLIT